MSDKLYTVSLKGASQNHPWIVVNADDVAELEAALDSLAESELYQKIADANALYQGVANVANPSGRAPAPATAVGSGEPAQETQAETPAPARQRGGNSGGSSYGRKKAAAGSGGKGGKKPKLSYEEASADCSHGERRRFTKPGADWVAYFCPQPKGQDECAANFIDLDDDQEG
jgi:hypothetical protein